MICFFLSLSLFVFFFDFFVLLLLETHCLWNCWVVYYLIHVNLFSKRFTFLFFSLFSRSSHQSLLISDYTQFLLQYWRGYDPLAMDGDDDDEFHQESDQRKTERRHYHSPIMSPKKKKKKKKKLHYPFPEESFQEESYQEESYQEEEEESHQEEEEEEEEEEEDLKELESERENTTDMTTGDESSYFIDEEAFFEEEKSKIRKVSNHKGREGNRLYLVTWEGGKKGGEKEWVHEDDIPIGKSVKKYWKLRKKRDERKEQKG